MQSRHFFRNTEIESRDLETLDTNILGQQEQPSCPVRSYDCTFCKRGFSNAQALGGHMNIHRRHRAMLKPLPNHEDQPALDGPSTRKDSLVTSISAGLTLRASLHEGEGSTRYNLPWSLHHGQNDCYKDQGSGRIELKQLQLFDDSPRSGGNCLKAWQDQRSSQFDCFLVKELDLELRLGPEP